VHLLQDYFVKLFTGIETGKTSLINWLVLAHVGMLIMAISLYLYIDNYDPAPVSWLETVKKS